MTVQELIDFLETVPDKTTIVLVNGYEGGMQESHTYLLNLEVKCLNIKPLYEGPWVTGPFASYRTADEYVRVESNAVHIH